MDKEGYSIDINGLHAVSLFSDGFGRVFAKTYSDDYSNIIILCIGTDRSTGDCLGPLVGHKLKMIRHRGIEVVGTLDQPVHAKNLKETMDDVFTRYKKPFIISIDACLGKAERIGFVSIGTGPLRPGAGVNKNLPEVGNMHIMGIVNVGGFMEYLILQNTRLSLVMRMADTISSGIHFNLWKQIIDSKSSEESTV